jgi:hypothetical protein
MSDRPTPPPGTPPGSLYWTVTDPDGTVVQDGWATPISSGAGAGQRQPTDTDESTTQETHHG